MLSDERIKDIEDFVDRHVHHKPTYAMILELLAERRQLVAITKAAGNIKFAESDSDDFDFLESALAAWKGSEGGSEKD